MSSIDKQALFLLYDAPDNAAQVQVVVKDETIWMTQKAMASLFDVNIPAISKHLKNIFASGELNEQVAVSKMEITSRIRSDIHLFQNGTCGSCKKCNNHEHKDNMFYIDRFQNGNSRKKNKVHFLHVNGILQLYELFVQLNKTTINRT